MVVHCSFSLMIPCVGWTWQFLLVSLGMSHNIRCYLWPVIQRLNGHTILSGPLSSSTWCQGLFFPSVLSSKLARFLFQRQVHLLSLWGVVGLCCQHSLLFPYSSCRARVDPLIHAADCVALLLPLWRKAQVHARIRDED